ncbi:MAG: DUF3394 domain-containing protein, partial [Candidatus Thiodiazotropha sp. (ex Notomyrtea botanica)]|nr:DUF3394 domain-containing protein [Candidatus Thiodiazotropha sp. (ex Notomyrtea botanica)]
SVKLLLIGVESVVDFVQVAGQGLIAILLFVSATQGWLMIRNRWWETVLLLVIAFSLFRPDFWRDQLFPAYDIQPAAAVETHLQQLSTDDAIRLQVEVEQDDGSLQLRDVLLALSSVSGEGRLQQLGFITEADGDSLRVNDIAFMSPAESAGLEPGYTLRISGYYTALRQPDSGWFLLPPLLILGGIVLLQLRRKDMK